MVRNIETPLARMVISGEAGEGTVITVDEGEGKLELRTAPSGEGDIHPNNR
jgi:hypothetical protein